MPTLKTDAININDAEVVRALLSGFGEFISDREHYRSLRVKSGAYFSTLPETLPAEAGWYVILAGGRPVYVGEADNLNNRLNSDNGSRDNFMNPERTSDSQRNFVKKFCDSGFLTKLDVWFVTERQLCTRVPIAPPLSNLDRCNIEKLLNVCRGIPEWMSPDR